MKPNVDFMTFINRETEFQTLTQQLFYFFTLEHNKSQMFQSIFFCSNAIQQVSVLFLDPIDNVFFIL